MFYKNWKNIFRIENLFKNYEYTKLILNDVSSGLYLFL